MQVDAIVKRRFEELTEKAEKVQAARETTEYGGHTIPGGPFHEWATNVQSLLARTLGPTSVHCQNFDKLAGQFRGYEHEFENCRAVFMAAREDYEGGYLFNVTALAKADALADAFSQGRELLRAGYKDPACVLARVALEVALKELAHEHGTPFGKLERMNAELCKANVYNMAKQKQITAWADIGNKAAHGQWDQYDKNDARAMLDGVESLVADFF